MNLHRCPENLIQAVSGMFNTALRFTNINHSAGMGELFISPETGNPIAIERIDTSNPNSNIITVIYYPDNSRPADTVRIQRIGINNYFLWSDGSLKPFDYSGAEKDIDYLLQQYMERVKAFRFDNTSLPCPPLKNLI